MTVNNAETKILFTFSEVTLFIIQIPFPYMLLSFNHFKT